MAIASCCGARVAGKPTGLRYAQERSNKRSPPYPFESEWKLPLNPNRPTFGN